MRERYELAMLRVGQIQKEDRGLMEYQPFFCHVAGFICMCAKCYQELEAEAYVNNDIGELQKINDELYNDILSANYEKSYANPAYAVKMLGEELVYEFCKAGMTTHPHAVGGGRENSSRMKLKNILII